MFEGVLQPSNLVYKYNSTVAYRVPSLTLNSTALLTVFGTERSWIASARKLAVKLCIAVTQTVTFRNPDGRLTPILQVQNPDDWDLEGKLTATKQEHGGTTTPLICEVIVDKVANIAENTNIIRLIYTIQVTFVLVPSYLYRFAISMGYAPFLTNSQSGTLNTVIFANTMSAITLAAIDEISSAPEDTSGGSYIL